MKTQILKIFLLTGALFFLAASCTKNDIDDLNNRVTNVEKLLSCVQSIEVIPECSDGSVRMENKNTSIRFEIYPASVAKSLVSEGSTAEFTLQAVSAATKGGVYTDIPVVEKTFVDSISMVVLTVDGTKMPEGFFDGYESFNARLRISDGNTDKGSAYFPLFTPDKYVCFTAREADTDISMGAEEDEGKKAPRVSLRYSVDGLVWYDFGWPLDGDTTVVKLAEPGDKVYFKAKTTNTAFFDYDEWLGNFFKSTKDVDVSGNVMTLLNGDNPSLVIEAPYALMSLFASCDAWEGCPIVDASDLRLPATTLSDYCYAYMFTACDKLKKTPILPATTMADGCYSCMFCDCASLDAAPSLPAKELAYDCYDGMFDGCSSLQTAPELPAKEMKVYCYYGMFKNSSLVKTPDLPAMVLAELCYARMFQGCPLQNVSVLPAKNLAKRCYNRMFQECTTLVNVPSDLIQAEVMDSASCQRMFEGCTELTTAPVLKASSLPKNALNRVFYGCKKLSSVTLMATDISEQDCLKDWLYNAGTDPSVTSRKVTVANSSMVDPVMKTLPASPTWSVVAAE